MAGLLAMMLGGFVITLFVAVAWEKALFSKINDDPVRGKLSSVAAAWLTCSTIAGFGMADGGPYAWGAFLLYLPPAAVLGLIAYRRALKLREEAAALD